MQLTHKIALQPSPTQTEYFLRAAGTARFVWNWGLAKWNELYVLGKKPWLLKNASMQLNIKNFLGS
jgi:putative transposase